MGYSSTLTIEELNVGGGKQPRVVVLSGAGLPFAGAEWGTEAQVITTWYPGNADEGTQQTLGPRELPSTWTGHWSRTLLPRSGCKITDENGVQSDVFAPQQLRDALDAMFREGRRLRVTWRVSFVSSPDAQAAQDDQANGTMVREGRCKTWKFPHARLQDIDWSFEFHWQSRGARTQKAISARDASMVVALAALNAAQSDLVSATEAKLKASNNKVQKSATRFTLGQLEQLANYPSTLQTALQRSIQRQINTLKQLGDLAQKIRTLPYQIANNAVAFARDVVAQAHQFHDQMSRVPPEKQSLKDGVSDLTRAAAYFGQIVDASARVAIQALVLDDQMRAVLAQATANRGSLSSRAKAGTRRGDIIAVYMTKTGDTPISISVKFYKSPDHASDILKANRLPWYQATLAPGKPIIIPAIQTLAGSGV